MCLSANSRLNAVKKRPFDSGNDGRGLWLGEDGERRRHRADVLIIFDFCLLYALCSSTNRSPSLRPLPLSLLPPCSPDSQRAGTKAGTTMPLASNVQTHLLTILNALINLQTPSSAIGGRRAYSALFQELPSPTDYPDYYVYIKEPRSLNGVLVSIPSCSSSFSDVVAEFGN